MFLVVIAAAAATLYFVLRRSDPKLASGFLHVVLSALTFPVVTFTGGMLACLLISQATHVSFWESNLLLTCCVFVGIPLSIAAALALRIRYERGEM